MYSLTIHKISMEGGGGSSASALATSYVDDPMRIKMTDYCNCHIKVNVKPVNTSSDDHQLAGEISLIVGEVKSNRVLFYKENL